MAWSSVAGKTYAWHAATNLDTGFNVTIQTGIPATPPLNAHTDTVTGAGQKFYRLRVE